MTSTNPVTLTSPYATNSTNTAPPSSGHTTKQLPPHSTSPTVNPPLPLPCSPDEHADLLLATWTNPLPSKHRQRRSKNPTTAIPTSPTKPMEVLSSFTQRIHTLPPAPPPIILPSPLPIPCPGQPAPNNPDNIGGYKTGFDAPMGTLAVCTLNINGLTESKLDSVLLHMRQQSISVYILIDTRLSPKNTHYISK